MDFADSFKEVLILEGRTAVSNIVVNLVIADAGDELLPLLILGIICYAMGQLIRKIAQKNNSEIWKWTGESISEIGVGIFIYCITQIGLIREESKFYFLNLSLYLLFSTNIMTNTFSFYYSSEQLSLAFYCSLFIIV